MREWFKHAEGYLNIDENNLYLTKTGNWSDTIDIEEKNSPSQRKNDIASKFKYWSFIGVFGSLVIYVIVTSITKPGINYSILIGLPVLTYSVYQYLSPEINGAFKIPISKIKKIDFKDFEVTIFFDDGKDVNVEYSVRSIKRNDIELLRSIVF